MNDPVKILVADDEPAVLSILENVLQDRKDCRLSLAADGEEALAKVVTENPDLLITDLKMPRLSGEQLTLRALSDHPDLTVLILTGNGSIESAVELMRKGVFDYLTKPFQLAEFNERVDRALERVRWGPLSRESTSVLVALMTALRTRDPYLKDHSSRVADLAHRLSLDIGLSPREAFLVRRAGMVHDLGKIGVPDAVLNKPGPLTEEEFSEVKKHPVHSAQILQPLREFRECIQEVYHHHERLDGTGYPCGLRKDEIPVGARIIAICDAYDAMGSDRAYRRALPQGEILRIMTETNGKHFDPDILAVFIANLKVGAACASPEQK